MAALSFCSQYGRQTYKIDILKPTAARAPGVRPTPVPVPTGQGSYEQRMGEYAIGIAGKIVAVSSLEKHPCSLLLVVCGIGPLLNF